MLKPGLSNSLVGVKAHQTQEHSTSGWRPWLKNVRANGNSIMNQSELKVKTNRRQARENAHKPRDYRFCFALDWLKNQHVCCDWFVYVIRILFNQQSLAVNQSKLKPCNRWQAREKSTTTARTQFMIGWLVLVLLLIGSENDMFVLIGWTWLHEHFEPITELGKCKTKANKDYFQKVLLSFTQSPQATTNCWPRNLWDLGTRL